MRFVFYASVTYNDIHIIIDGFHVFVGITRVAWGGGGGHSKHFSCGNSVLPARKVIVMGVKTKQNENKKQI